MAVRERFRTWKSEAMQAYIRPISSAIKACKKPLRARVSLNNLSKSFIRQCIVNLNQVELLVIWPIIIAMGNIINN